MYKQNLVSCLFATGGIYFTKICYEHIKINQNKKQNEYNKQFFNRRGVMIKSFNDLNK